VEYRLPFGEVAFYEGALLDRSSLWRYRSRVRWRGGRARVSSEVRPGKLPCFRARGLGFERVPPVVVAPIPRRTFPIGNRKLSPSPDGRLPRLFFTSQSPLELEFASHRRAYLALKIGPTEP
jgi:hypothetical protein